MEQNSKNYIDTGEWSKMPFAKDLVFMAKPCEPKLDRRLNPITHYALHKDGFWYGTDGHRLHMVSDEEMPVLDDGVYEVTLKTKTRVILRKAEEDAFRWPNVDAVFPQHKNYVEVTGSKLSDLYTKIIRAMEENTLEVDYVKDITDSDGYWTVYVYGSDRPVAFEKHTKLAFVMPMRL